MGEPAIIYDKPRPGPKPLHARSLRVLRPLRLRERAFLAAYCDAPAHGIRDTKTAKDLLCAVLPVRREALVSSSNFHLALDFVMPSATRQLHSPPGVFMDRKGGADALKPVRPLQPEDSRFLAALSVAPAYAHEDVERAKTILSVAFGIPRAQLECDATYSRAMDCALSRA